MATGERALFTRDIANVVMDLNDVEAIDFNALGGADKFVVNDLSGTDVVPFGVPHQHVFVHRPRQKAQRARPETGLFLR